MVGYIDAGTGSAIMAALAGGVAGLWVFVKTSIRSRFGRGSSADRADDGTGEGAQTDKG